MLSACFPHAFHGLSYQVARTKRLHITHTLLVAPIQFTHKLVNASRCGGLLCVEIECQNRRRFKGTWSVKLAQSTTTCRYGSVCRPTGRPAQRIKPERSEQFWAAPSRPQSAHNPVRELALSSALTRAKQVKEILLDLKLASNNLSDKIKLLASLCVAEREKSFRCIERNLKQLIW